ncbi:putative HNHc nuclease [Ligilactobacillus sp. LYQ139]|uniref:putative HNHc nuclease n=1 Tax=Ligilactobacillus sp. LYQ139 TaxID=3378800 RepID=UPI003854FA06
MKPSSQSSFYGTLESVAGKTLSVALADDLDLAKVNRLANGRKPVIELKVADGRVISPEQRKLFFALLRDYCDYTGYLMTEAEDMFKWITERTFQLQPFSMSDCSVSQANMIISVLIEYMFEYDIPFKYKTWQSIPDYFPKQMLCLRKRRCVICGRPADRAHVFAVGMGRNREKIHHGGNYVMSLCRAHHTEQHKIGIKQFIEKYHIKPVKVNREVAKQIGWEY